MSRVRFLFPLFMAILLAAPAGALAQDATPAPEGSFLLGEPVSIPGLSGEEIGTITVTEIVDPFDLYLANYPPVYGYHYVLATVTVANTGPRPLPVDPRSFVLHDTDGFLSVPVSIRRPDDDTQQPDFASQELATGGNNSGVIGFQVLNGSTLARMTYSPGSAQTVDVLEFGTADLLPVAEPISVIGTDQSEIASAVIEEVVDPFEEYADNAVPERGSHYVLVHLSIDNPGPRTLEVDPRSIALQDREGFLYAPVGIRPAEEGSFQAFEYQDLPPGATAGGAVGFLVINGIELERVLWQQGRDRTIVLADLTP